MVSVAVPGQVAFMIQCVCVCMQVAILKDNVRKADEEIAELDKLVESVREVSGCGL